MILLTCPFEFEESQACVNVIIIYDIVLSRWYLRKDIRSSFEIDVEVYSLVRQNIWHFDVQSFFVTYTLKY